MSESVVVESAPAENASEAPAGDSVPVRIESPPPAPAPAKESEPDPRMRLLELAGELARSRNRRLIVEFLRLRRAIA